MRNGAICLTANVSTAVRSQGDAPRSLLPSNSAQVLAERFHERIRERPDACGAAQVFVREYPQVRFHLCNDAPDPPQAWRSIADEARQGDHTEAYYRGPAQRREGVRTQEE